MHVMALLAAEMFEIEIEQKRASMMTAFHPSMIGEPVAAFS
ncbi:hypothetical protein At1D1609_53160 (plasmid) [Agrobacterium tumefaciens]|uniref:Uncharacterized protein n=1 Tax=Agrobacterium tumefaciens TaxID=358 RepID=A0A2L2LLZ6_AGRTU|nr:hypothetical protein At1D1609_53160 [Agrobacterium tumefaciens]